MLKLINLPLVASVGEVSNDFVKKLKNHDSLTKLPVVLDKNDGYWICIWSNSSVLSLVLPILIIVWQLELLIKLLNWYDSEWVKSWYS